MKKKVIFLVLTLVFCIGCFNLGKLFKVDVLEDEVNELDSVKHLSSLNTLSMMLETEAGSGKYTLENRSSWPTKDDGYVFNETLSKCENGSKLSWREESNSIVINGKVTDKCYLYFDALEQALHEICNDNTFACYVAKKYTGTQGDNYIYYHDSSLENGAEDNSYRYAGSSELVNNYVCFGSDASTCPNDNLYRIIGVFKNRVKVIQASVSSSNMLGENGACVDYESEMYYWNSTSSNTWRTSELNTINLNTNYLNNIGSIWESKIDETTWKIGGNTYDNIAMVNAQNAYLNEIINPAENITYNAKIGLIYVSDYGFAASPSAWGKNLMSYDSSLDNWMYVAFMWTITKIYGTDDHVFYVDEGNISIAPTYERDFYAIVRPVFYLKPDVARTMPQNNVV